MLSPMATTAADAKLCIDTIRTLAIDAIQKANSGHPGTPMALAPVTYSLWSDTLKYDPALPNWPALVRPAPTRVPATPRKEPMTAAVTAARVPAMTLLISNAL